MRPALSFYFAILVALLLMLNLAPAIAWSQAAPAAPAGTGGPTGAPVPVGAPGPFSASSLAQPYVSPSVPADALTAGSAAVMNPLYGGLMYNWTPPTNPIGAYLNACAAGAGLVADGLQSSVAMRNQMDRQNDEAGFQPYPGIEPALAKRSAATIISNFKPEAGCQKFIDKNGAIGPWGRTMLGELEQYKDVYEDNKPKDAEHYCPTFTTMDASRRKMFWLWFFASVSQPESGCKSNDVSGGTGGANIGLFQLDPPACRRVGMPLSASELLSPSNNIRCAVAVFANEMRHRGTIMVGTSKGQTGTYWGTLRNDDNNAARGSDISAALKTRSLIRQYPDCQK